MKEIELLSELSSIYLAIDPLPTILQAEDSKGITWLQVNVCETGLSEKDQRPIATRKNISYYVYHRGQSDELAYYYQEQPINTSEKSISSSSGTDLFSYNKIYLSNELRNRVTGSIIKAAVYFITAGTVNKDFHWAQDAIKDPTKYLNAFMCECANNVNVRSLGNSIPDADLDYVVNANVPVIEAAYNFTS